MAQTNSQPSNRIATRSTSAEAVTVKLPKRLADILEDKTSVKSYLKEVRRCERLLLKAIREAHPKLKELLKKVESHWEYEDLVYRFYHHSFKAHFAADLGNEVFDKLLSLVPWGQHECPIFIRNLRKRCRGKKTQRRARADIELLFHAHYFLKMAVKYGKKYKRGPRPLPSGYAALLCLYGLR